MGVLMDIPFRIDRSDLLKRMHLEEGDEMAADMLDLAARAEAAGRPKAIYDNVGIDRKDAGGIIVRGVRFASQAMAANLKDADRIYPYVCTCGIELDSLDIPDDGGLSRFGLDMIKEMALRQAMQSLHARLLAEFTLDRKASMNPGSGDRRLWPLEEQGVLFSLLGDVKGAIGVTLTETWLMLPNKSVSGFYFKTDKAYHNCQLCQRESCPNRSAPFDPVLWEANMPGVEPSGT
jgi:hypothetical protein